MGRRPSKAEVLLKAAGRRQSGNPKAPDTNLWI